MWTGGKTYEYKVALTNNVTQANEVNLLVCICVDAYVLLSDQISYAALQFLLLLQYINIAVTMVVTRAIQFSAEQRPSKMFSYYISLHVCSAFTVSKFE